MKKYNKTKAMLIIVLTVSLSGCVGDQTDYVDEDSHPIVQANEPPIADNRATRTAKPAEASPEPDKPNEATKPALSDNITIKSASHETVLGEFKTKYYTGNKPRMTNIKIAADAINETIVKPGETFSYNDTVGPTSKQRGYKIAKVIRDGKEYKGYGGGVCQVSSTLFNAVDYAGMEIVERHSHTKQVAYVEEGRDAATSHGSIDFKFRNNTDANVKIKSVASDGVIHISVVKLM